MNADDPTLYKILRREELAAFVLAGGFDGSADDARDGFIHLSSTVQVRGTLERHFAAEAALYLVAVAEGALTAALRWEASRSGEVFPHLYAALHMPAVRWIRWIPDDGPARAVLCDRLTKT